MFHADKNVDWFLVIWSICIRLEAPISVRKSLLHGSEYQIACAPPIGYRLDHTVTTKDTIEINVVN